MADKDVLIKQGDALRASIARQGELVKTLKKEGAKKVCGCERMHTTLWWGTHPLSNAECAGAVTCRMQSLLR